MKRSKIVLGAFTALFLSFASSPFIISLVPQKTLQEHLFNKIFHTRIAKRLVKNQKNLNKKIIALIDYSSAVSKNRPKNIYLSRFFISSSPLSTMIYGGTWCDGTAFVFMHLLSRISKMPSRFIDIQHHTCAEVYFEGEWKLTDPYFSFLAFDKKGKMLSLRSFQSLPPKDVDIYKKSSIPNQREDTFFMV